MPVRKAAGQTAISLLFATVLLDVLGLSLLYPVAAFLVLRFSKDPFAVTLMTVCYAAAQFISSPVLGRFGDTYGRRPVLLLCLCGSFTGYLLLGVSGSLLALLLSRVINGAAAGSQSVAAAALLDLSTPQNRSARLALIGSAWGIGLVLGPTLGASLAQWRLDAPAYLAAALAGLSTVLCFLLLPESRPEGRRSRSQSQLALLNPLGPVWMFLRRAGPAKLLLVLCLFSAAFQGVSSVETFYLIARFGVQPWQLGVTLATGGACIALMQRIVPTLVKQLGDQQVATLSLFALAAGALAMCSVPAFWLAGATCVLRTALSALVFPTTGALLNAAVAPDDVGAVLGVNAALSSLMAALGPLAAGALYSHVATTAPYWLGATVFLLAAALLRGGPVRHARNP